MKLSNFDYLLPKELIAQYPLIERDKARLLVLDRKSSKIQHRIFKDIIEYFKKEDLIVLNDTKVLPCRLIGSRLTRGKVELLLLNRKSNLTFDTLIKPSRIKIGEKIVFNNKGIEARVIAKNQVTFYAKDIATIYNQGIMPLPPYIKRKPRNFDNIYYQTVYAQKQGSTASPTAGLHFTKRLITKIKSLGMNIS